ncbi:hypothetical protein EON65_56705 [archaeon]|nr:MAG: hypothetical protein EON65_56705 [archaeon]
MGNKPATSAGEPAPAVPPPQVTLAVQLFSNLSPVCSGDRIEGKVSLNVRRRGLSCLFVSRPSPRAA